MPQDAQSDTTVQAGAAALARLRRQRARPERARRIGEDLSALRDRLARDARRFGGVGALWAELCPPELVERTRVESFERGVLRVVADDAAARYALDRALRSGLAERIVRRSSSAVRRVRVSLER